MAKNSDIAIGWQDFGTELRLQCASAVAEACARGSMHVELKSLKDGVLEALWCAREGYRGDEDGFGVEPDEWAIAFLRPDGTVLVPFAPVDSPAVQQARQKDGVPRPAS